MIITTVHKTVITMSLLLLLAITTGCGFQLRGSFTIPKYLQNIYITPDDPYEPFQKGLCRALRQNNVQVVSKVGKNIAVLALTSPNFSESILAFNANGQAQMFRLAIYLQYRVTYNNKVLRPFTTIQYSRDFTLAPNQLLSGDNERRTIKDALYQEAITMLLRQLATIPAPE